MQRVLALLLSLFGLAGCGSDVDFDGDFTLAVTNGANGCGLENWTEGETATGIPVELDEIDDSVTARVDGGTGAFFNLVLGSQTFMGVSDGDEVEMTIFGTRQLHEGDDCTYTYTVTVNATLDGDTLTGSISYHPETNGHPSCGELDDCSNRQSFNGTRAPRP